MDFVIAAKLPLVVAVACLLVVPSCGGDGDRATTPPAHTTTATRAEQLLTDADVRRYSTGTPERALLEWWRSAQYADLSGFLDRFEPMVRRTLVRGAKTTEALTYFSAVLKAAKPKISSVERSGDRATIFAVIEFRHVKNDAIETTSLPRAFTLVRRRSAWWLLDDLFFQSTVPDELRRES